MTRFTTAGLSGNSLIGTDSGYSGLQSYRPERCASTYGWLAGQMMMLAADTAGRQQVFNEKEPSHLTTCTEICPDARIVFAQRGGTKRCGEAPFHIWAFDHRQIMAHATLNGDAR
jgi:hypothetical protein